MQGKGYGELYGIDQYISDDRKMVCSNWFEYHFLLSTWGTVIAPISFSNHFRRSLINHDLDRMLYTEKYQEILDLVLFGGYFIYSPSGKTIEKNLDADRYSITYFPNLEARNLDTVCIRKLC